MVHGLFNREYMKKNHIHIVFLSANHKQEPLELLERTELPVTTPQMETWELKEKKVISFSQLNFSKTSNSYFLKYVPNTRMC